MWSEVVTRVRNHLGWTQAQLADELEVSRQAVYYWERGMRTPPPAAITRLADLAGGRVIADIVMLEGDDERVAELAGQIGERLRAHPYERVKQLAALVLSAEQAPPEIVDAAITLLRGLHS